MPTYLVGYDLNRPGADYDGLIKHLKGYGTWWHYLDSTWLIVTNRTATEVRDAAREFLDSNDRLLVAVVQSPSAWRNIPEAGSKWLQANLS